MSAVHVVILENYSSSEGPEVAPLIPLEQYRLTLKTAGYQSVLIASSNDQTGKSVKSFDGRFSQVMRSESGLDCLAELSCSFGWDDSDIIVCLDDINVLLQPEWIGLLIQTIRHKTEVDIATLAAPVLGEKFDPDEVKVITDREGQVLLFSRAFIPFDRNGNAVNNNLVICPTKLCHVNFYAARVNTLKDLGNTEVSPLEHVEQCDLLRALSNSYRIQVVTVDDSRI